MEEPPLIGHFLTQKPQGQSHLGQRFARLEPAALIGDAERTQSEAGGGNAGNIVSLVTPQPPMIHYKAGDGMGTIAKETETRTLQIFQKRILARGKGWRPVNPGIAEAHWDRATCGGGNAQCQLG
jgi:hypothetical protein